MLQLLNGSRRTFGTAILVLVRKYVTSARVLSCSSVNEEEE